MRVKNLALSEGERTVKLILEESLVGTPFQLWGKVRLGSVIEKEEGDRLPRRLFDYLTRAELDFLIISRIPPHPPILAIEFDGSQHATDRKIWRNDIRKNQLCKMAGMPLLRVSSREIGKLFGYQEFLSYIIDVMLRYKHEHEGKAYQPPEDPDQFTEMEFDEIRRHELPCLARHRQELAATFGIVPVEEVGLHGDAKLAYDFNLTFIDYASSATSEIQGGRAVIKRIDRSVPCQEWSVVAQVARKITLRTRYMAIPEKRPPWPKDNHDLEALEEYSRWIENGPWLFAELPGVLWSNVARNILEALCLRQLLKKLADSELRQRGQHERRKR